MRETLEIGEIYHVYNRGVDKRTTFINVGDYRYFIHLLYVLNESIATTKSANHRRDYKNKIEKEQNPSKLYDGGSTSIIENRNMLVEILAFVLMPNHYHLLLRQVTDDGIAKFMQKIGTGYTMMFNDKHKRSGSLFQGRYKSVHISSDEQLQYIPHYIHLNPLGNREVTNAEDSLEFLKQYKWSSFPDYAGGKNFPSVSSREFILSQFDGSKNYVSNLFSKIEGKALLSSLDKKDLIDFNE